MNGLTLARVYAERHVRPLIAARFSSFADRIAIGLVGEGSECFGFDDAISRDHDWDPSPCLWLTASDHAAIGDDLDAALRELPPVHTVDDQPAPPRTAAAGGRRGVFAIEAFYARFTGLAAPPASIEEWRGIPETNLAVCTNGEVFRDSVGAFTAHREALLAFYPEDVRLKKMAARCARLAQAGQYNVTRAIERGDAVVARCALGLFLGDALSLLFLLNRRYRPFYKWMHRAALDLPLLGPELHGALDRLATCPLPQAPGLIEEACALLAGALRDQRLSDAPGTFLLDHAASVQSRIVEPHLRRAHVMSD